MGSHRKGRVNRDSKKMVKTLNASFNNKKSGLRGEGCEIDRPWEKPQWKPERSRGRGLSVGDALENAPAAGRHVGGAGTTKRVGKRQRGIRGPAA